MYVYLFIHNSCSKLDASKAPKVNWHKAWDVRAACVLHGAKGREGKQEKNIFKTLGQL